MLNSLGIAAQEPIREPSRRRGQSRFAPRTAQNWDSPRRFSDRLLRGLLACGHNRSSLPGATRRAAWQPAPAAARLGPHPRTAAERGTVPVSFEKLRKTGTVPAGSRLGGWLPRPKPGAGQSLWKSEKTGRSLAGRAAYDPIMLRFVHRSVALVSALMLALPVGWCRVALADRSGAEHCRAQQAEAPSSCCPTAAPDGPTQAPCARRRQGSIAAARASRPNRPSPCSRCRTPERA